VVGGEGFWEEAVMIGLNSAVHPFTQQRWWCDCSYLVLALVRSVLHVASFSCRWWWWERGAGSAKVWEVIGIGMAVCRLCGGVA
jgi:hypothetical protein